MVSGPAVHISQKVLILQRLRVKVNRGPLQRGHLTHFANEVSMHLLWETRQID